MAQAFRRAEIESNYLESGTMRHRSFEFSAGEAQSIGPATTSALIEPRTTVRLVGMKDPYKRSCPKSIVDIGHRLIEHCLPFFSGQAARP